MQLKYEVNITGKSKDAIIFDTAKEAVKYVLKALHDVGFTVDGKTFEEKFEEIVWVGKGKVVS
jgi:hypothetical protein